MSSDAASPLRLGVGMSRRARSQSVLARRRVAATLIGAVGRSSVGFGLAVGRSTSIRPTVDLADVNSSALRPPTRFWRHPDDDVEPAPSIGPTGAPLPARQRPTWTDQIIQRSEIAGPGTPMSRRAPVVDDLHVPDDFEPFGDSKLDRLRLLMLQDDEPSGSARSVAEPTTAPTRSASALRDAGRHGVRGDTAAGRATGPGRLGRVVRPEPVEGHPRVADTAGGPSRTGPATTPSGPSSRASGLPGRRASAGAGRSTATEPTKLDRLRALLIEQGEFDPDSDSDGSADSTPAASSATRQPPRGRPRDADHAERAASRPPSGGSSAARPTDVTRRLREAQQRTVDRVTRPAEQADAPEAAGPVDGRRPGGSDVPSPPGNLQALDRVGSRQQLRLQRLLGRAPHDPVGDADVGGAHAATPSAMSDDVGAAAASGSVATAPTVRRVPMVPAVPKLPRADDLGVGVLRRRVTLPRVMSDRHHPPTAAFVAGTTVSSAPPAALDPSVAAVSPAARRNGGRETGVAGDATDVAAGLDAASVPTQRPHRVGRSGSTTPPSVAIAPPTAPSGIPREIDTAATIRRTSMITTGSPPTPTPTQPVPAGRSAPRVEASTEVGRASVAGAAATPVARRSVTPPTGATGRSTSPGSLLGSTGALLQALRSPGIVDRVAPSTGARSAEAPVSPPPTEPAAPRRADRRSASSTPAPAIADVASAPGSPTPAEQLASTFLDELARTRRRTPSTLPSVYRPMADTIADGRRVKLSTDTASRRALRSVGKVAATTDDTIHLDPAAVTAARLDEVIAHELTHVAHPSPTPRFFDDIDDSPEERKAEQIGRIMAGSPLAPTASVAAPARSRDARATDVVRRSPATPSSGGSSPGSLDASALAARLTGGAPQAGRTDVVRRTPDIQRRAASPPTDSPATTPAMNASDSSTSSSSPAEDVALTDEEFLALARRNLQPLLHLIEDRLVVELERRGGRTWGKL